MDLHLLRRLGVCDWVMFIMFYCFLTEDINQQLAQFAKELTEKTEECSNQKDEITNLLHQIINLQKRIRAVSEHAKYMLSRRTWDFIHSQNIYSS